jgi:DNA-binding NtrC family response regulator
MTRILCVDDDIEGMVSRKEVLESAGHQVREVASPEEALRIIKTEEIELAIVDYYLVNSNGLALATEMKRLNPDLGIIMLSGFGQLPGEAVGIANSWILKGSGPKPLLLAVQKVIAGKRREPTATEI